MPVTSALHHVRKGGVVAQSVDQKDGQSHQVLVNDETRQLNIRVLLKPIGP